MNAPVGVLPSTSRETDDDGVQEARRGDGGGSVEAGEETADRRGCGSCGDTACRCDGTLVRVVRVRLSRPLAAVNRRTPLHCDHNRHTTTG